MTKFNKILALGSSVATVLAFAPSTVLAQGPLNVNIVPTTGTGNFIAGYTITQILGVVINLILGAAGVLAFIFLIIGGLQWMLAGGDKEGTEKARKRITAALIGLAIVFSAYALMFIIQALFGVNLLSFTIANNFHP